MILTPKFTVRIIVALLFLTTTFAKSQPSSGRKKAQSGKDTPPPRTPPASSNLPTTFTLASSARTSAGVYKQDGTLVRTLWSGVTKDAGTYTVKWDGTDDHQQPLPEDNYNIKVLSNNVQYTWEGVIGNTSTGKLRQDIHTSFEPMNKMVITGGKAYYSVGYNEGNADVAAFDLNNIQVRLDPFTGFGGWVGSDEIATDGTSIYIASVDNYHLTNSFIYAKNLSDNTLKTFSSGTSYQGTNIFFQSVADLRNTSYIPTGIAVSSSFIFVSYKAGNIISVLDKNTGGLVREIPVSAPSSLSIDGSNLWVTTANNITKCAINGDGSLSAAGPTISGFSDVVDIRVGGSILGVVDGGNSQQVKAFNTNNGTLAWTLGQAGGIKASPLVTDDKFAFWSIHGDGRRYSRGGICFAPDGSFWVIDPSNNRMQHYDRHRNLIERIMYMQHTRSCNVVGNNYNRVIANGAEYEVDYTKPVATGWKLKYNWEGNLSDFVTEEWIKSINTLSNGRTYGLMARTGDKVGMQIVELDPKIGIRYTNVFVGSVGGAIDMHEDGSIYGIGGNSMGETEEWGKMTLNGFDGNNDPIYTTSRLPVKLLVQPNEPRLSGPRSYPYEITSSNILVLFAGDFNNNEDGAYHLGGMDATTGKMMFRTSMSTFRDYNGSFPSDGSFDIGNGVGNAASVGMAKDRSIIWGYNGEFWKAGQTNMYNHYYDNGLFIGQFGVTGGEFVDDPINFPGMAGNAYMPQLIKLGSDYYLYHNDESVRGGIHRWKITGLNTIQEQVIPITSSFERTNEDTVPSGTADLMVTLPRRALFTDGSTPSTGVTAAGWSVPNANSGEQWIVRTSRAAFDKRKNPDIDIIYNASGTKSITRSLENPGILSNWQLSGKIAYNGTNPNYWDGYGKLVYFDILDNTGKIITRIYQVSNVPHDSTLFKVNNTTVFTKGVHEMQITTTRSLSPLEITKKGESITVTYAGFSASVTTPFETGANLSIPTTMRLQFNDGSGGDAKWITLDGWKFSSIIYATTPAAPVLKSNDEVNILDAVHELGSSEILVSEDGGTYSPYKGPIYVGDVSRAAGYWKFKIKAAQGRNESAEVMSPAFSERGTPPIVKAEVTKKVFAYRFN